MCCDWLDVAVGIAGGLLLGATVSGNFATSHDARLREFIKGRT